MNLDVPNNEGVTDIRDIHKYLKKERFLFISLLTEESLRSTLLISQTGEVKKLRMRYFLHPSSVYIVMVCLLYLNIMGTPSTVIHIQHSANFFLDVLTILAAAITNGCIMASKFTRSSCVLLQNFVAGTSAIICKTEWQLRPLKIDEEKYPHTILFLFELLLAIGYIGAVCRLSLGGDSSIDILRSSFMLIFSLDFDNKLNALYHQQVVSKDATDVAKVMNNLGNVKDHIFRVRMWLARIFTVLILMIVLLERYKKVINIFLFSHK